MGKTVFLGLNLVAFGKSNWLAIVQTIAGIYAIVLRSNSKACNFWKVQKVTGFLK
jgi:hypothetical protein